jgi:hypothetical protein
MVVSSSPLGEDIYLFSILIRPDSDTVMQNITDDPSLTVTLPSLAVPSGADNLTVPFGLNWI